MQTTTLKLSTVRKRFKDLRLLVANSIVRNNEDIRALLEDIDSQPIASELLDEYSIRYLFAWLLTKNGIDQYTKNIDQAIPECVASTMKTLTQAGWYPFQNEIALRNEAEIVASVFQFLDRKLPSNLGLVGFFYEYLTTHSIQMSKSTKSDIQITANSKYNRRIKGQFYTPPNIVIYCLNQGLSEDAIELIKKVDQDKEISIENRQDIQSRSTSNFKVLDPALGSGNFLIGLLSIAKELGLSDKALVKLASTSLYGIDIDGRAVSIARFLVLLKLLELMDDKTNFYTNLESLAKELGKNLSVSDSTLSTLTKRSCSQNLKFDLVITNPPYVSFGARDQQVIPESLSSLYKKYYPNSSEYKIRLNSIFHDVAIRLTKDLGRYALLVPDSFLTGRRYAKLRSSLLSTTKIISLTELPENTIQNATVGRWCLAVFENSSVPNDYNVRTISFCDRVPDTAIDTEESKENNSTKNIICFSRKSEYALPLSRLKSKDHQRLQLVFNQFDDQLFELVAPMDKLKTILRGHTGIRSRIGQKNIISDSKEGPTWQKGIISGSSVTPYKIEWTHTWINTEPKNLFSGGFDSSVIKKEKIMVRQTGDTIVAAYDDSGLYHLNNVHSFSSQRLKTQFKSNRSIPIHVILAWLNSNLFRYLYRLKTREDGRALAQIDIETVEEMPIPKIEEKDPLLVQTAKLSKLICKEKHNPELLKSVNSLVYASYGLNENQILYIEENLKSRNPKGSFVSALPLTSLEEALKISQSQALTKAEQATIG